MKWEIKKKSKIQFLIFAFVATINLGLVVAVLLRAFNSEGGESIIDEPPGHVTSDVMLDLMEEKLSGEITGDEHKRWFGKVVSLTDACNIVMKKEPTDDLVKVKLKGEGDFPQFVNTSGYSAACKKLKKKLLGQRVFFLVEDEDANSSSDAQAGTIALNDEIFDFETFVGFGK